MNPLELIFAAIANVLRVRGQEGLADYVAVAALLGASKRQADAEMEIIAQEIQNLANTGGTVPQEAKDAVKLRREQLSEIIQNSEPNE